MDWGKVFANDATNKNLISKTTKKPDTQLENGQKT